MNWRLPWVSRAQLEAAVLEHQDREGEANYARNVAEKDAARAEARLVDAQEEACRLRDELAAHHAALDAEIKRHAAELAAERERYSALVAQMVELKKLDYGPTPVVPAPPKTPVVPIPATVMQNIARVSDPDTRERRQIEGRVRDLLTSGVPEVEVAGMVLAGEEVPEDL